MVSPEYKNRKMMEKGAKKQTTKKKGQTNKTANIFSYFLTELLNNTLNPKLCVHTSVT